MSKLTSAISLKVRKLRDWYFRGKYQLIARLLGRAGTPGDLSERGLLIIQLDALPYETFCAAVERGYMPFIRRQLIRRRLQARKWYCPIPSNTPSVQAAVMYGNNDDIPGFRWYEKQGRTYINFKNPLAAGLVEERLNSRFDGLLAGGSSYCNVFSGQASTSIATIGTFTTAGLGKRLRGLQIFALVLLNFITVIRTLAYTLWEFGTEIYDWINVLKHRVIQRGEYLFPLFRILMNVWVREIITVGAMADIARGSPSIYISFLAYDELAHQRGPFSKSTLNCLRTIDRRVRRMVQLAHRRINRDYNVFIFSDHGIAASMPFFFLYRETLGQCVARLADGKPTRYVHEHCGESQVTYARILALRLETYERGLVRGLGWLVRAFRSILVRRVEKEQEPHAGDDVVVAVSSPLGHIYLPVEGNLQDAAILQDYPVLIPGLVKHEGIGLVVTRHNGGIIVRSKHGIATIGPDGKVIEIEGDPLFRIEPKNLAIRGLVKLMRMSNSGDVVVQGADHGRYVVNFEEQMAAHGALGGLQNSAFILHPPEYGWIGDIDDPRQLHEIFLHVRALHAQAHQAHPMASPAHQA